MLRKHTNTVFVTFAFFVAFASIRRLVSVNGDNFMRCVVPAHDTKPFTGTEFRTK